MTVERVCPLGTMRRWKACGGTFKNKLVHHRHYRTWADVKRELTKYIKIFHNRQRKQDRLGYLSPDAFTLQIYDQQQKAA